MRSFLTLWRKELNAFFLSPVAYVTMVLFVAVCGATFLMEVLHSTGTTEPLAVLLFASAMVWMTVLITVVSMRLFAEEKRAGTLETLMTAPVSDVAVVMGKYVAALNFLCIVMLPALSFPFILAAASPGIVDIDLGAFACGLLITLLMSAFCLAIGVVVSLTSRNQIVAAILCFCAVWAVFLLGPLVSMPPFGFDRVAEHLSVTAHIEDFARGFIDTRPVVLYVSGTGLLLFTAVRMLESRRWR